MERWKAIPGYPGYEASNLGRIRSNKNNIVMKQRIGSDGYPRVTLQHGKNGKTVKQVHILIASAFIGPSRGKHVLHIDGDRLNSKISNLEYGTREENMQDKYRHGTHNIGEANHMALIDDRTAIKIKGIKNKTQKEIAEEFGISRQAVSDIKRGITWSHLNPHVKKMREAWEKYCASPNSNNLNKFERSIYEISSSKYKNEFIKEVKRALKALIKERERLKYGASSYNKRNKKASS